VRTRTADFYRVKVTRLGITITYKTAGTPKVRGSRTRHHTLWVGLWVRNNHSTHIFFTTKNLLALSICTSYIKIFRHKRTSQPNVPSVRARGLKLVSGETVAGSGTMRGDGPAPRRRFKDMGVFYRTDCLGNKSAEQPFRVRVLPRAFG